MNATRIDRNENGPAQAKPVKKPDLIIEEVDLEIEALEEVIAPKIAFNHNESMLTDDKEVALEVEELEEVIAPGFNLANHNETMLADDEEVNLEVEELEEVIAPGINLANHNETMASDSQ